MQVIFIHHSCFLVEVDEKVLIFDWFAGDRVNGYTFGGQIPEYEPDTPIYVFASHKHRDHFDMDVLHWAERYSNIHYIFSKDCRMSPHFLEKHGFDLSVRELITYVSPCEKYQVDRDAALHGRGSRLLCEDKRGKFLSCRGSQQLEMGWSRGTCQWHYGCQL